MSGERTAQGLSDDPEELPGELPTQKPAQLPPEVVREKVFALKPMTVETAIEQVPPPSPMSVSACWRCTAHAKRWGVAARQKQFYTGFACTTPARSTQK